MHVELLRNVMINGESRSAGSLVELSVADANLLIGNGKAQAAAMSAPEEASLPVVVHEEAAEAPRPRRKHPRPQE